MGFFYLLSVLLSVCSLIRENSPEKRNQLLVNCTKIYFGAVCIRNKATIIYVRQKTHFIIVQGVVTFSMFQISSCAFVLRICHNDLSF